MSGVLRPVGHLPASVYWVRRVLVLALLIAVVVLLSRVFGGGADPKSTAAPGDSTPTADRSVGSPGTPPPSTQPTSGPTSDPASAPTSTATSGPVTATVTTVPMPNKDGRCAAGDVRLVAMPAVRRLPAGRGMNLHVRMSAVRGSCTANVDPARLVVTITSGRDRIWTTAHCVRTVSRATVVLTAGRDTAIAVAWTGHRSIPGCRAGQPFAKRGTYVIQGSYDARYSTPQVFHVV
jgi:hypothetical protein